VNRPCVGCGYCCQTAACALGASRHGPIAPCPELRLVGDIWRCGPVLDAIATDSARSTLLIEDLAIGEGCCSPLNSQRQEFIKKP